MVELLQNLIFGVDYPGLSLALDPLTIALIGQGLTKGFQGFQQRRKGRGLETQGKDLFDKQVADFRAGKYDLSLGQGVYDAFTNTQRLAEEAAQRTGEAGRSAISGAIANTRYGDPRTAFLVPKTAQAAMKGVADANLAAAQQQAGATMGLAQAEQGIKSANEQARQQLESMMMARGAGQEQQGLGMFQEGTQDMIGGFGDATSAYISDPGSIFGEDGLGWINYGDKNTSNLNAFRTGVSNNGVTYEDFIDKYFGGTPPSEQGENKQEGGRVPRSYALGGILNYEYGGRTMITPGEPSHKTNPIHMINNNGQKVGEAMGGELVFDDEATRLIIEALKANDPEALFEIIKRETQQPQFQMDEAENMA